MDITYRDDALVTVEAAMDLFKRSTLGERRPLHRPDIFEGMLKNASLPLTAWHGERLGEISRSLTDFTYVAYLADLAVDEAYQRRGIGKHLIGETIARLGQDCMVVLLAARKANECYAKRGFQNNLRAWILNSTLPSTAPDESGLNLQEKERAEGGENGGVRNAVAPKRLPKNDIY
ncbi:MAG: GNAT family N-acetyltransferase [Pedosphaera sp.]|nr:GNAT family N-acetyltransferase [Pedosphaera sp.]